MVGVDFSQNHIIFKSKRYLDIIDKYSKKFNINKSLISAIIKEESYFNPLAKSHIPAYGLMQIIPTANGKDAYRKLTGENKILSPKYLLDSKNNIELGTQYLEIIQQNYLKGIIDPKKLLYCTISTYNIGIGSLFRSIMNRERITDFNNLQKESIEKINKMTSEELYSHLISSDKLSIEAKHYLPKVLESFRLFDGYYSKTKADSLEIREETREKIDLFIEKYKF